MATTGPGSSDGQPHDPPGIVPSHGISIDAPSPSSANKPPLLHHVSSPAFESPLRHHIRTHSSHRQVKETLNARSEYTNSEDDGTAQHRINQYIIKQEIGRGSFGAVHLAVDQYGKEYAVKEFSKSRLRKRAQSHVLRGPHGGRRRGNLAAGGFNSPLHHHSDGDLQDGEESSNPLYLIKEEIAVMKKLDHSNLVSLIEVLDDPEEDSLYMVMEMCKKGVVMRVGLDEQADPYGNEHCRMWFRDLILGIEYLHAQGVVHRDIKPDNCLLTEDDVLKIVDFGVSEMFEKDSEMLTIKSAGSPAFLPPELCVAKHGGISGKAADIWSMGVTLYCLRYGRIPFEKTGIFELYDSIRSDPVDCGGEEDEDFRDLMCHILEKDPAKRIDMATLREHPWVTKRGSDPLLSAEENTADLVEPPTEEEMNHAITGNMSNLLVVLKAAKKFKKLVSTRRPNIMESILGGDPSHLVEPPLQMGKHSDFPHLAHKSHSVETYDRRPIERALVAEGVHRKVDLNNLKQPFYPSRKMDPALSISTKSSGGRSKEDSQRILRKDEELPSRDITASPDTLQPLSHSNTLQSASTTSPPPWEQDGNRGHAHDPLEDHLYLRIGPSTFAGPSTSADNDNEGFNDDENMTVSESPGAAEGNIYETAYREEIERIQSQHEGNELTVYLTRRVEDKKAVGKLLGGILAAKNEINEEDGTNSSGKDTPRENGDAASRMVAAMKAMKSQPGKEGSDVELPKEVATSDDAQPGKEKSEATPSKEEVTRNEEPQTENQPDAQIETKQFDGVMSQPKEDEHVERASDAATTPQDLPLKSSSTSQDPPSKFSSASQEPLPEKEQQAPAPTSRFRGFGRGSFKGFMNKMKGKAR